MSTAKESAEKQSDEVRLPNSEKIYVTSEQSGVRVPFREIALHPTRNFKGEMEDNPPVRVYDTSGPWDDPTVMCDVREGLPALRREWIVARDDVEEYEKGARMGKRKIGGTKMVSGYANNYLLGAAWTASGLARPGAWK